MIRDLLDPLDLQDFRPFISASAVVATSKITTKEPPFGILISSLSRSNTTTAATFRAVSVRPAPTRTLRKRSNQCSASRSSFILMYFYTVYIVYLILYDNNKN